MESDYEYLKEQERTWESLGFNKFMERTTLGTNSNVMSSDDFNAMMQDGFINSSRIVSLSAGQLVDSIMNAVIDIGDGATGAYTRIDGPGNRFLVHDSLNPRITIGRKNTV